MILKASRFKLPQDNNKNDTRRSSPAASAIMRTTLDKILLQWYNLPNSIHFLQFLSCKQQFYIKTIPPLQTSNTIPEKKTGYSKHEHKIILGKNSMVLLYYLRKRKSMCQHQHSKVQQQWWTHTVLPAQNRLIKIPHMFQFKSNYNYLYLDDKLNQEHREHYFFPKKFASKKVKVLNETIGE